MLVPLGAVRQPPGVAQLAARSATKLAELEAKLASSERDRAADAELIGNLLAEIAERDRRIRSLEAELEANADRILALEVADASHLSTDERVSALEQAVARDDAVFAEVLRRLSAKNGTADPLPSELHDLLAATLSAIELTRTMTGATNDQVEQMLLAVHDGPDVERGLAATLKRGQRAEAAAAPADHSVARVVDRLREIERRERELAGLRERLLDDAATLVGDVRALGDAVGNAARPPERARPPLRRRPSSLRFRR